MGVGYRQACGSTGAPRVLSHRAKPERQNAFMGMVSTYSKDCCHISYLFVKLCLGVFIAKIETHGPEPLGEERVYFSS